MKIHRIGINFNTRQILYCLDYAILFETFFGIHRRYLYGRLDSYEAFHFARQSSAPWLALEMD